MQRLSKEFVVRTIRAVVFIILVIISCTAISSAGIYMASRFGLTTSREQVPLTALSIGADGSVQLPVRGKMVEGDGWKLRNNRDDFVLTLDNAVIEGKTSDGGKAPAITVCGDLTIECKKGSGNRISSGETGILIDAGTLTIRGAGDLEIKGNPAVQAADGIRTESSVLVDEGMKITAGAFDGVSQDICIAGKEK